MKWHWKYRRLAGPYWRTPLWPQVWPNQGGGKTYAWLRFEVWTAKEGSHPNARLGRFEP